MGGHPLLSGAEPDEIFSSVDGHSIVSPDGVWQIEIHSIHDEGGYRWIQLALDGKSPYSLTLRLSLHDDSQDVLQAVTSWVGEASAEERRTH